jgi:hypothetical protein
MFSNYIKNEQKSPEFAERMPEGGRSLFFQRIEKTNIFKRNQVFEYVRK